MTSLIGIQGGIQGAHYYNEGQAAKAIIEKIPTMNDEQLATLITDLSNDSTDSYRKFKLGIILEKNNLSAETLDKIASINDNTLYERMGSVFHIMRHNTKGRSVMRLVAQHPNVSSATLIKLYLKSDYYLKSDLALNPKTSEKILRELFALNDPLINGNLAFNPNLPMDLLLKLAKSNNGYILRGIAENPKTPRFRVKRFITQY